jgi:hypothetical protein
MRYFFHLEGDLPAHDILGRECFDDDEARAHGNRLAHDLGTQKSEMIREQNFIRVIDEGGRDVARIALASMSA